MIKDFLKMENEKITKAQLFDYLSVKLNNLWFISHRPSYDYFTDDPFDFGTASYEISEKRNNNTQNNIA